MPHIVNSKKLQGVPVRTQTGQQIGKCVSLDVDADTGKLASIHVKVSGVVPALLDQEALVAWSQIVSMNEQEIVVRDGLEMEKAAWVKQASIA